MQIMKEFMRKLKRKVRRYKNRVLNGGNMFKKIKNYLFLQRKIQVEILETLCTICLYFRHDGHYDRNPYTQYMDSHFKALKTLSEKLRNEYKYE